MAITARLPARLAQNERHYGALQGREKRECGAEFGYCQVARWRRGAADVPPPATAATSDSIDRRYAGVPVPPHGQSASLWRQCCRRGTAAKVC